MAEIREFGPSDIAALLPGGDPVRLSPPRGWHLSRLPPPSVDHPIDLGHSGVLATWPGLGRPGTRYILTIEQVGGQILQDGLGSDDVGDYILGFISEYAAGVALRAFGFFPLVIEEPERRPVTFATHIRCTMSGTFDTAGGDEEWTTGTSWASPGNMPDTISDTAMQALYQAASDYHGGTGLAPRFTSASTLRSVEYAVIRPDGKVGGGQVQRFFGTPVAGAGLQVDYALSFAVTLDAQGAKGGRYGRFYPPPQAATISQGRCSAAEAGLMLGTATQWLAEVSAALNGALPSSPVALCVASQLGGGGNRNVANLRVGRVPDHQSRRRRGLSEDYSIGPWPV